MVTIKTDIINFFEGEDRIISFVAVPKNKLETAVVTQATFELFDALSDEKVESGTFEKVGDEMTATLLTDKKGEFTLKITAKIGRETYIDKVRVRVM